MDLLELLGRIEWQSGGIQTCIDLLEGATSYRIHMPHVAPDVGKVNILGIVA